MLTQVLGLPGIAFMKFEKKSKQSRFLYWIVMYAFTFVVDLSNFHLYMQSFSFVFILFFTFPIWLGCAMYL